jgi:hypothetical protein
MPMRGPLAAYSSRQFIPGYFGADVQEDLPRLGAEGGSDGLGKSRAIVVASQTIFVVTEVWRCGELFFPFGL